MQVFFSLLSNDAHVRKATYYSVVTPFKIVLFPTSIICQALPRAPALRANVKPALSHPVTGKELDRSTCYIQASLGAIALSPSLISSTLRAQLPFAASLHVARATSYIHKIFDPNQIPSTAVTRTDARHQHGSHIIDIVRGMAIYPRVYGYTLAA